MSPIGDNDYDDDTVNGRKSFLRPIESPSPGSTIVGSATSNDGSFSLIGYSLLEVLLVCISSVAVCLCF